MPFKAIDEATGKPVLSFWFKESAQLRARHPRLKCPCCESKVSARGGESRRMVTHFFHVSSGDRPCLIADKYKNKSSLVHHTLMVEAVRKYLTARLPNSFTLDLEHRSPAVPDRIADLAVLDPDGAMVEAHEVQLTRVTVEELEERTASYDAAGVECVWWLGKGCDTPEIKDWAVRNFGYCLVPDYSFFTRTEPMDGVEL